MSDPKKMVFPGQRLSVEEEYTAGPHTYADEDGNVIASVSGQVEFNDDLREVNVAPRRESRGIDVGTVIVGRVSLVKDAVAIIAVGSAENNGKKRNVFDSSAVLGVARVSRDFIRSMKDHFKIGDFVRARVTSVTPYSIEVSTAEKGMGLIVSRADILEKFRVDNETFPVQEKKEGSE